MFGIAPAVELTVAVNVTISPTKLGDFDVVRTVVEGVVPIWFTV